MTEKQKELYNLLNKRNTLISLSNKMKLSPKQTYQRILTLENKGYNIERKDYSTGDVSFYIRNRFCPEDGSKIIFTAPGENFLRVCAISDLHLGNSLQNIDALNKVYDFCYKNNIHIIFNTGDIFQGLIGSSGGKILQNSYEEQFEKNIKLYPFDKSIINYCVLGNHDYSYLDDNCFDIKKAIKKKRYDIYPIDYRHAAVLIKNEKIALKHNIEKIKLEESLKTKIVLQGHSHTSKQKIKQNNYRILTPTLSNLPTSCEGKIDFIYPQFNILNLDFDIAGKVSNITTENYIILDKIYKINESSMDFNNNLNLSKQYIIQNEESPKKLIKK